MSLVLCSPLKTACSHPPLSHSHISWSDKLASLRAPPPAECVAILLSLMLFPVQRRNYETWQRRGHMWVRGHVKVKQRQERGRDKTVKACGEMATKEKQESREREIPQKCGTCLESTWHHIKRAAPCIFKIQLWESERNALRVGWGAIFPAQNLFCCLPPSHNLSPSHTHAQNPTIPPRQDATRLAVCT